jgi:hypothetical protein
MRYGVGCLKIRTEPHAAHPRLFQGWPARRRKLCSDFLIFPFYGKGDQNDLGASSKTNQMFISHESEF